MFECVEKCLKLVIVVIYGVVLGGGFEFVMFCYMCFVIESVKFGLFELIFGLIFGFVGI